MSTIILGIESSCDDTSAAVIKDGYLLSNVVSSQAVHEAYGGVVPELASRADQGRVECGSLYKGAWVDGVIAGWSIFCKGFCTFIKYSDD